MNALVIPVLSASGGILTALTTWVTMRSKARHKRAQLEAEAHETARKADADAYDNARKIWGDLIEDLVKRTTDQDARTAAQDNQIIGLKARVETLESARDKDRAILARWIDYAKELGQMLRSLGAEPPPPPHDME